MGWYAEVDEFFHILIWKFEMNLFKSPLIEFSNSSIKEI